VRHTLLVHGSAALLQQFVIDGLELIQTTRNTQHTTHSDTAAACPLDVLPIGFMIEFA
jgi:hypothetical protein